MTIPQYFAQIDENNVVIDVAVVSRSFMDENPERYPGTWVETFFDVPGKIYAGIGMTYDAQNHNFISPPSPPIPSTKA